jgi:hypothetical protein
VNRQLTTVITLDTDDLEKIPGPVGAEIEDADRRFIARDFTFVEMEGDGVCDIGVIDAVFPGRPVNLHVMRLSYYEIRRPVRHAERGNFTFEQVSGVKESMCA